MISVHDDVPGDIVGRLAGFRKAFHRCLTARADALFELTEALLCADGPVRSLVELSVAGEHRRGHGSLYAALNRGRIDVEALKTSLAAVPVPRAADGRIVLAVDVTCWLRPEAHTSPQRVLCHTYGRGKDTHIMVPGWPYSLVTALETGRSSWTAPLDVRRLAPGLDAATVTAGQLRDVVERLIAAGQWQPGDQDMWIVADAGYDGPRLAFLLADLPVKMLVRMRSDRVLRRRAPATPTGNGRPRRHGGEFVFGDPTSWGDPDTATVTDTRLYGTATARAWHRLHPRLTHRTAWVEHTGTLPIIEGTVILLTVDRLPSGATAKPVWLWCSQPDATATDVDLLWQAFLRRFDIEHTFRMLKQTLGWTTPKLRDPHAADRWTWLVLAAYTQLRLARTAVADLRRPWERQPPADRLSPARVRRGFRNLRGKAGIPASAPKPSRPGPGRPPGHRNQRPASRHDVHIVTSTKPSTSNRKPTKSKTPRPRRTG
ncbi:NF041680 family putative transposase [Asanoa iriomotensis]|uniref:NF041680 family putative transposase n=1 Tax=Asanoa iriomotensis TaxID=234613 RepID=UPI001940F5C8|nr:NF041680 family putative transposase [Asanoa iriomotensis]